MISDFKLLKLLKLYMYENNLSQKQLAEKIEIDRSHLSKIFNNRYNISPRTRYKIEKVLNVSDSDED